MTQERVTLDGLGICEHCNAILSIDGFPADAMDADWKCHKCGGILTHRSFGYAEIEGKWRKVYWVGPEKKWVNQPSANDFDIGNWRIVITSATMSSLIY